MNLDVITELLADTKVNVTTALSGAECLDKLREGKYDLVLLDQMMPGLSGTETLHLMRRGRLADGTPVIALTADAIVGARESYLREGFTDYLSKPILYEELEKALKKHLPAEKQLAPRAADEDLPVLLVWGDDDTETPVADGYTMKELIPGSRLEVLSGAGHFAFLNRPEEFTRLMKEFLR